MNFDLSDEQEQFRASVERFAGQIGTEERRALRAAPGGYPRKRWKALAELGTIALAASEEAGGLGGSAIDLVIVAEALGKAIAPDPWLENGVLPALLLSASGSEAVLGDLLTGDSLVAVAFAERMQRFSLEPKAVTAKPRGAGFALHGEKTFVLGGGVADRFLVSAECEGSPAWFLVPKDREGAMRHTYVIADGSLACELRLAEVEVAAAEQLPIDFQRLDDAVGLVRLLAAAEMLGLAQRLFDETLIYMKQREQFGVAIASFQALQHRLVECYTALEQSRSMVYRVALLDRADPAAWNRAAAGAKAYVAGQADLVAREAVQMHGGMGITDELAIGHAMKRILLLARLFGDRDAALAEYAAAA